MTAKMAELNVPTMYVCMCVKDVIPISNKVGSEPHGTEKFGLEAVSLTCRSPSS